MQERNVNALKRILECHKNKNIVIGTHGTALCTIIHDYDGTFGYKNFMEILSLMPWIVKFSFQGEGLIEIEMLDVLAK